MEKTHRPSQSSAASTSLRCPRCGREALGRLGTRCAADGAALCVASELPAKGDPLLGQVIAGRYPVVGVLGRGGMGAVYRGVQEPLGRAVALKVIRPEATAAGAMDDDTSPVRRRFFREARAISTLSHPGIVSLYDYGETEDGLLFMVMELLEGPTLRQALKAAGRLPLERAVEVATQVLDALGHAHRQGVVHRDLKPGNVMLTPGGGPNSDPGDHADRGERVKLLDFGLAKIFAADAGLADITVGASGTTLGTPRYMAPEQINNAEVSPQTDLYAVGVMLYALLSGRPPFDGPSAYHIHRLHLESPPPRLPDELGVPESVQIVLRHALEKRAEDRPTSAETMAQALRVAAARPPTLELVSPPRPTFVEPDLSDSEPTDSELSESSRHESLDETSGHGESSALALPVSARRVHLVLGCAAAASTLLAVLIAWPESNQGSSPRAPATPAAASADTPRPVATAAGASAPVPASAAIVQAVDAGLPALLAPEPALEVDVAAPPPVAPVNATEPPHARPARARARRPSAPAATPPKVKVERL